jgi:hypothetical protein
MLIKDFKLFFRLSCHGYFCCAHVFGLLISFLCAVRCSSGSVFIRPCPAWERRTSTCGRALLPHADKLMFVYVLELCTSEAKRATQDTALRS